MIKTKNIFLFFVTLVLLLNLGDSEYYFGNKVWVYWDKPIEQAPIFVRLCY
jgi:hypothetical protein